MFIVNQAQIALGVDQEIAANEIPVAPSPGQRALQCPSQDGGLGNLSEQPLVKRGKARERTRFINQALDFPDQLGFSGRLTGSHQ